MKECEDIREKQSRCKKYSVPDGPDERNEGRATAKIFSEPETDEGNGCGKSRRRSR